MKHFIQTEKILFETIYQRFFEGYYMINPPNDLVVNNILTDIFRDDDFCINRITLEINAFQKKTDVDYKWGSLKFNYYIYYIIIHYQKN